MKIANFTDAFLPQVNGVVYSVLSFTNELARRTHQSLIFAPRPARNKAINLRSVNAEVVLLPSLPVLIYPDIRFTLPSSPLVLPKLYRFKPDIIHFQAPFAIGLEGMVAAKLLKIPIIGTFHTYFMEPEYLKIIHLKRGVKPVESMLWRFTKMFYDQANYIIVPSRVVKKDLKVHKFGAEIEVVPTGLELDRFKKISQAYKDFFKQKWNLSKKVILHFGRISCEKNIDLLIDIFFHVHNRVKDVSFLIIGDGPARKELEKQAVRLGLKNKVVFTGFIDRDDVIKKGILQVADVFVTCSTADTQGLVLVEAMAAGLPVIALGSKAPLEIVKKSFGFLIKLGDNDGYVEKLALLLNNVNLCRNMGAYSKHHAKKYDIRKVTDKMEALYKEVIKSDR